MLGVDGNEQLHSLAGVQAIEEHRGHLDAEVLSRLGQRVEREEAVLAIEHAQDSMLLGDLEQSQVVLARHGCEGEALLGRNDDRARDGREGARVLAIPVVADELVDLAADDRALVGCLAFANPLLEGFPVDARAIAALALRCRGRGPDSELDQPIDVLRRKGSLEELHAKLFHAVRGNGDHQFLHLSDGLADYSNRWINPCQHLPFSILPNSQDTLDNVLRESLVRNMWATCGLLE